MSEILRQIDSDVRKERALSFLKKYGITISLVFISIIVIVLGFQINKFSKKNHYEESIFEYLDATSLQEPNEIIEHLNNVETNYETMISDYASIKIANIFIQEGKQEEGQAKLLEIINNKDGEKIIKDIARYFYVMSSLDKISSDEINSFLDEDIINKSLMKHLFIELKAIHALSENNEDVAHTLFKRILLEVDSSSEIYSRAKKFDDIIN